MSRHNTVSRKNAKTRRRETNKAKPSGSGPLSARRNHSSIADLQEKLRRQAHELQESLAREDATSEVLRVINSSPRDPKPVFTAILENATRICEAKFGTLFLRDDDAFRVVAMHNAPPAYAEARQRGHFNIDKNNVLQGMVIRDILAAASAGPTQAGGACGGKGCGSPKPGTLTRGMIGTVGR